MNSEKAKISKDLKQIKLSAMVICQNEEAKISRCLESLAFCDEIVVIDGGSIDKTIEIASSFTENVFTRKYTGTNNQKEFGRTKCYGKWILNLDADEYIPEDLAKEISLLTQSQKNHFQGYRLPIKTHLGGYFLRHNGYYPGYQKRLFQKDLGHWSFESEPHDRVILKGKWGKAKYHIMHETGNCLKDLEDKAIANGKIASLKLMEQHYQPDMLSKHFRPSWRFIRSYIFKHGFLDRKYGFELAKLSYLEGKIKYSK